MTVVCAACGATCDGARFCPSCGRPLDLVPASPEPVGDGGQQSRDREAETRLASATGIAAPVGPAAPPPRQPGARHEGRASGRVPDPGGALQSGFASHGGRFVSGTVLAARYRVVGLLGRGGMGEVYRADDLTLGQTVALKFLPAGLAHDRQRLDRFRAEVSISRQVSHPNVCRVYDIGEVDGHVFLSMEYIDGEDLGTLLRRIGRLPPDKGIEISRQICAGLAAAHDRGVVHRDLKPGNVMIDGRGQARIADFGLAFGPLSTPGGAPQEIAGTPAYMAPELFDGKAASVASDIYALGLVLYEIFTGKCAFTGPSVREYAAQHRERQPSSMTALVAELDPAIERAIARCLAKAPTERSASALAVSASLPGGDPLAAALARGETPSPELVASAGSAGLMKPARALLLLGAVLAGLGAVASLMTRVHPEHLVPMPKSGEVLRDRAQQVVAALGYRKAPVDVSSGFVASAYLAHANEEPLWKRRDDLRAGQPSGLLFWYRQAASALQPSGYQTRVGQNDPPETEPGMVGVTLDPSGRLQRFLAVPLRNDPRTTTSVPDWSVLFREAGLDASRFSPATPRFVPPVFAETRAAWEGTAAGRSDIRLHVEAAASHGEVVYFETFNPWNQPANPQDQPEASWFQVAFMPLLLFGVLASAILLAVRNLRLGRGDRRGAFRIALFLFLAASVGSIAGADIRPRLSTPIVLFLSASVPALFLAAAAWLSYVALEPYVRRRLPQVLISWSRLLAGHWRDPLVGRDVLVGTVIGLLTLLIGQFSAFASGVLVGPTPPAWVLDGFRFALVLGLNEVLRAIGGSLGILLLFFCLTLLTRRQWVAAAIIVVIQAANIATISANPLVAALVNAVRGVLWTVVALLQFGLLTLVTAVFTTSICMNAPLTLDLTRWFAPSSVFVMALIGGLAAFGAWAASDLRALVPRLLGEDRNR